MKLKYSAIVVALVFCMLSSYAQANHAVCSGQQTTVFFVNGVYAEKFVENHTLRLRGLLKTAGVSMDCVHIEPLSNHDEAFNLTSLRQLSRKLVSLVSTSRMDLACSCALSSPMTGFWTMSLMWHILEIPSAM